MTTEHDNPEADEAHDIVMKQRGYERLHKDLQADAAKLAMWDELVDAFGYVLDKTEIDYPYSHDVLARARAIK